MDLSREEEQAGGAEILLASLTGAKRVSLLEAAPDQKWRFFGQEKYGQKIQVESKVPDGYFTQLYEMALQGLGGRAGEEFGVSKTTILERSTK